MKEQEFIKKLHNDPSISYHNDVWDSKFYTKYNSTDKLYIYYSRYIDIWWDPEIFPDPDDILSELCTYCHNYFDIWWSSNTFSKIALYKNFKPLCDFCIDYFDKWWDPDIFLRNSGWGSALVYHALSKIGIWGPDYIRKYPNSVLTKLILYTDLKSIQKVRAQMLLNVDEQ